MNENLAAMMFDFLKERVGEEVSCTKWTYGIRMECEGVLEEVVPFEKVMISKSIIPFVGVYIRRSKSIIVLSFILTLK